MSPAASTEGYTLVEMLAALAIIGFAFGGLLESLNAIRLAQAGAVRGVSEAQSLARAKRDFARLFDGQGPFGSDARPGLAGDRAGLTFDCGGTRPCSAKVSPEGDGSRLELHGPSGWSDTAVLPGLRDAKFVYTDADGQLEAWPASVKRRRLASVVLTAGDPAKPATIASTRLWLDETPDCQFDPIAADCREGAR